jgi:hypothetical protein
MAQERENGREPVGPSRTLSEGASSWLREHLNIIEERIIAEAGELAKAAGRNEIEPVDVASAAMSYAPGTRFPTIDEESFGRRLVDSFSGITLLAAAMGLVFGIIGALRPAEPEWFDMVKLFAGAVVGSAGAHVVSGMKRK